MHLLDRQGYTYATTRACVKKKIKRSVARVAHTYALLPYGILLRMVEERSEHPNTLSRREDVQLPHLGREVAR